VRVVQHGRDQGTGLVLSAGSYVATVLVVPLQRAGSFTGFSSCSEIQQRSVLPVVVLGIPLAASQGLLYEFSAPRYWLRDSMLSVVMGVVVMVDKVPADHNVSQHDLHEDRKMR
jgi:hypothetical protein